MGGCNSNQFWGSFHINHMLNGANQTPLSGNESEGSKPSHGIFPETMWSLVQQASNGDSEKSAAALRRLCEVYREPVLRRLGAQGCGQNAEDLANGFMEFLLEKNRLGNFVRGHAKFRTFLITCLDGFCRDEWRKQMAAKRGGGEEPVSFEEIEVGRQADLEKELDRDFALTIHRRVAADLGGRYAAKGLGNRFELLRAYMLAGDGNTSYAELGVRLGLDANAVKQAVFRLRKDYLQGFRDQIADTAAGTEVEGEMRYLISLLADTEAQLPQSGST